MDRYSKAILITKNSKPPTMPSAFWTIFEATKPASNSETLAQLPGYCTKSRRAKFDQKLNTIEQPNPCAEV